MKKTPKIVLAALLSMVLSVSAGCAAPGTPSLDRMEQTETAEQQYDEEERVVVRQLALAAEEQQNSGASQNVDKPAANASSTPVAGQSYEVLYPDLVADDELPADDDTDADGIIKSQDDYYELAFGDQEGTERADLLPSSVDNSTNGYFPQIDSQGGLGSCTCWAMVYYQFTYTYNYLHRIPTTRDTTFSPRFTYNLINGGNKGGSNHSTVYTVMKQYGNVFWNDLPYDGKDYLVYPTDASIYKNALNYKLKSYQKFDEIGTTDRLITSPDDPDLIPIKTALANHEVLKYSTYFSTWRGAKLKATDNPSINQGVVGEEVILSNDSMKGGHAMTIVGYNDNIWTDINNNGQIDSGEMGALKVANSHGDGYANKGFVWVAYDALNCQTCVSGGYNAESRQRTIRDICRIDITPEDELPYQFAEYTINTADRDHTTLVLQGEYNGSTTNFNVDLSRNRSSSQFYYAYDGSQAATDASVTVNLATPMEKLKATSLEEVKWNVILGSDTSKGKAITLKAFKIYDTKTGESATLTQGLPLTVERNSSTLMLHDGQNRNAIIYYRGYKKPVMQYILANEYQTKEVSLWFNDEEQSGYVYKYILPMGTSRTARVKFGDGNGRWDDNNGQLYEVKPGVNLLATPNVADPLTVSISSEQSSQVCDLGYTAYYTMEINGGYSPYQYRMVVTDTKRNAVEYDSGYDSLGTNAVRVDDGKVTWAMPGYQFKKETTYQVTISARDVLGTTASKTATVIIKNLPLTFTKFSVQNAKSMYNLREEMLFDIALENDNSNGGNCNATLAIMKNGKLYYTSSERMKKYNTPDKSTGHTFSWTPTEGGDYRAIAFRMDYTGEYAFKTMNFKVTPSDVRITSMTASPNGLACMGDKVTVTAQGAGGTGSYQYRYAVVRYGKEVSATDFSSSPAGTVQMPFETGGCEIVATIKDGNGTTATAYKTMQMKQARILGMSADKATLMTEETITITPETANVAAALTSQSYVYTATLNGTSITLPTNSNKTASWKPSQPGTYTVKLTLKNGDQVMTTSSKQFTVIQNPKPQEYKIRIGVVYYINDSSNASQFKLHYWNQNGLTGDATCVRTTATSNVSVGSAYWNGAAQMFYIYEATVPLTATGYKFHIGDRWFGSDGSLSSSNAVYVFEYGRVDRAMYRKES